MALKQGDIKVGGGERKTVKRERKIVEEEGLYALQILDIDGTKDKDRNTGKEIDKVLFTFVVCDPDSPFYGVYCWQSFTPKVTPAGENRKESNLHKFLSAAFFKKKGVPESFRKEFLATQGLALNKVIGKQFVAYLTVEESATSGKRYNKIGTVTGAKVEYPVFERKAPELDERAKADDTSYVCHYGHPGELGDGEEDPCAAVVHGWKKSEPDEDGNDWMSQDAWVKMQRAKFGAGEGDTDAPIFCGRHYQRAKNADLGGGESKEDLPF